MAAMQVFSPISTVSITAETTSGAVAIDRTATTLELNNTGSEIVFVRWAPTSPTAVVTDYPVLPGHCKAVRCESGNGFLAAITGTGSALLYVTSGNGS